MVKTVEELFEREARELYDRLSHEFSHRMYEALDDAERTLLATSYLSGCMSFFIALSCAIGRDGFCDLARKFIEDIQKEISNTLGESKI